MTNIKFTAPSEITVSKRNGASVTVDPSTLPADMVAQLFEYGLRQKIADSASGAPETDVSQKVMESTVANLIEGLWAMRSPATESDPLDRFRIKVVRQIMAKPQNAKVKASYDAIDSADQKARKEFLLDLAAKNAEAIDAAAQELLDAEIAAQKQANKLGIAL